MRITIPWRADGRTGAVEIVFIRNDVDYNDPAVMNELLTMEFGENFIASSSSDGGADLEAAPDQTEETVTYMSRSEYMAENS